MNKLNFENQIFAKTAMKHVIAALSLFCLAFGQTSHARNTVFDATYEGEISGFDLEIHRKLQKQQTDRYRLHSEAKRAFASIEESSEFALDEGRILPSSYYYKTKIIGMKREQKLSFDWESMKADYVRTDKTEKNKTHTLEAGYLDPSVYQLSLQRQAFLSAKDSAEKMPAKQLSFQFVKRRKVKDMLFTLTAVDKVFELNGKKQKAVQYTYFDKSDNERVDVWLLPETYFHIAKIIHQEDDETSDMTLKQLNVMPSLLFELYLAGPSE